MKSILFLLIVFASCKTMKIDSAGNKKPTKNTQHIDKVHPYGFWTGRAYVYPVTRKKQ